MAVVAANSLAAKLKASTGTPFGTFPANTTLFNLSASLFNTLVQLGYADKLAAGATIGNPNYDAAINAYTDATGAIVPPPGGTSGTGTPTPTPPATGGSAIYPVSQAQYDTLLASSSLQALAFYLVAGAKLFFAATTASALALTGGSTTPTPSPAPAPIIGMTVANTAKLRAAVAANRNAIVAAIGPSTTAGQTTGGGTSQAVNSWPAQTAALLNAAGRNASAGGFFGDKAGWGSGSQTAASFMSGDSRVVLTGSAAPTSFGTAGGNGIGMTAAGTIEFTPQVAVSEFTIYYRDAVGQDWSWSIDGGTPTVVSGKAGTGQPAKIVIPAGSAGTHKLTIAWVAGNARFVGVSAYNNAGSRKEIVLLNWGVSGARSAQLIEDVDAQASRLKTWTALAPDLTILDDFAINDWRQSVPVDTFKANLLAAINKAKETGDVVVTTPLWDASTSGASASQNDYAAATIDVATAAGVPIIDIRAAWKSYAEANAKGWYSDSVHPATAGYAAKSPAIVYFIQQALSLA